MLKDRWSRHFYTSKGYLGCGPGWIEKGDLICVIQGSRLPVILRKMGEIYHFISTTFVLGIMDGEVGEMVARNELPTQRFEIH